MFASFLLPSVFEGVEARHLLVFYKQLADYGRDNVAFVGEPAYFRPPAELEAESRPEWQASWRDAYEYEPPADLEGVDCEALPRDLLAPRLARAGSSWKLYGQMVTRRLPELEAAFDKALDRLCARHPVEAAIAFANLPSLSHVAGLRGLPVIHTEFGPLRKPGYVMTGYWDLKGVTRRTDAARRFRHFRREVARGGLSLLDPDELLHLVRRNPLPPVVEPVDAPFRVGVALQGEENVHVHGVSALDCLSVARQHFHQRDILVRHHSGGLARYSETLGVTDVSRSATEFILKSEQIVTVNSGVALEALLLGRRCIVLGDSPFSIASDRSLDTHNRQNAARQRMALNFLVLGYVVPCALMFDADYTRWRLGNPSEADIFRFHQGWYRKELSAASSTQEVATVPVREPVAVRTVEADPTPPVQAPAEPLAAAPILMVYPYCLDQVGHGNIQRVLSMARHIAASGFTVDLVYQGNPRVAPVADQYGAFRRVYRVEGGALSSDDEACARRLTAFYGTHEAPAAHLTPSAPLTTLVRALIDAEPYQAVVATYAWMAPVFAGLARRVPLVCDVQDILHEHADACHRTTGHSSSFSLPATTEAFLWRQWDALVAITPEDMARIRQDLLPQQRLVTARHAAPEVTSTALAGEDDVALYAASDNMSNVQALHWLLDRVWPRVIERRPQARLRIAGLICRALPETAHRLPGVEVLGFRSDLRDDLARAGVVVAPYLYGSGLKIKVVEAACAGKAIVTTRAGVAGAGLRWRDAIAVEDEPTGFADALVRLLGNSGRRASMANAALEQARALYSPAACYGPMVSMLRSLAPPTRAEGHGFPAAALRRITTVVEHLQPTRIVLWGNGAHTRSMVAALNAAGLGVRLIIDGRGTSAGVSPEGIPVRPGAGFDVVPGDLVILSSETFEKDMWQALATYRSAGGWVLGLWDERRVSRAILDKLSPGVRAELGVPSLDVRSAGSPPRVVVWDSSASHPRWWRIGPLQDLARAAHERGVPMVVAGPSGSTMAGTDLGWPQPATFLPILELDGRAVEEHDAVPDSASDEFTRLVALVSRAASHAVSRLALGRDDLLVLMSPSLTECFAVARLLAASGRPAPSIVVYGLAPTADGPHWSTLAEADRRAYWKLAVSALAEAASGRLELATSRRETAALAELLDRPVRSVDPPAPMFRPRTHPRDPRRPARVLCFGHVCSNVRPVLEAIVGHTSAASPAVPVSLGWRSSGHGSGPSVADRWAIGLATMLGVELLDDRTPSEMLAAIADADVIVMADGPRNRWAEAICAHAAVAGVPVLASADGVAANAIAAGAMAGATWTPGITQELAPALERLLMTRRLRTEQDANPPALAPASTASMFEQLLGLSAFVPAPLDTQAGPVSSTDPSLMTEIAHAATN